MTEEIPEPSKNTPDQDPDTATLKEHTLEGVLSLKEWAKNYQIGE